MLRELLLAARFLDEARLAHAEAAARKAGVLLVHAIHRMGLVEDRRVSRLLSTRLGLERVDLDARTVHPQVLEELSWRVALKLRVLPLGVRRDEEGNVMYIAMSDPTCAAAVEELEGVTGMELRPLVAEDGALERALRRHYPDGVFPPTDKSEDLPTLEPVEDAPPVVVGAILEDAAPVGAGSSSLFLTESTADALGFYFEHMGPNARRPFTEADATVEEAREVLDDTTRDVLRRFAPATTAADEPAAPPEADDLSWLRLRRLQAGGALPTGPVARTEHLDTLSDVPRVSRPPSSEAPTTSVHDAPTRELARPRVPASRWRPELGAVCVVSPDARVRGWLADALAPVVVSLHEAPSLARARELMRKAQLELVLLIYPRREALLEGALRDLQEVFRAPRVLVVSSDASFDDLAGVTCRLAPPPDVEALPGELVLAMKRICE